MTMDLKGKKIVLGLSGGVACYKAADLCRQLVKEGASVQVVMTESAERFITLSANSAIDNWIFDGIGEDAGAPGGGSVATSTFSLALRWGCDPIVFIGLAILLIVNTIAAAPGPSALGLGMTALGGAVYVAFLRNKARPVVES